MSLSFGKPETSAVSRKALSRGSEDILPVHVAHSAAVATAAPTSHSAYAGELVKNGPQSECGSCDIFQSSHDAPHICIVIRGPEDVRASLGLAILADSLDAA